MCRQAQGLTPHPWETDRGSPAAGSALGGILRPRNASGEAASAANFLLRFLTENTQGLILRRVPSFRGVSPLYGKILARGLARKCEISAEKQAAVGGCCCLERLD